MAITAFFQALRTTLADEPTDRFVLMALGDGGTGDDDYLLISDFDHVMELARIDKDEAIKRIEAFKERGIVEYNDEDLQMNIRGERSGFLCRLRIGGEL